MGELAGSFESYRQRLQRGRALDRRILGGYLKALSWLRWLFVAAVLVLALAALLCFVMGSG
jgi:hypothetical protein